MLSVLFKPPARMLPMRMPAARSPDAYAALLARLRDRAARGEGLPAERDLATELAVTRHQLRRALADLRERGELGPTPAPRGLGRSARALVRRTHPIEVAELRAILEPALARMAAVRATPIDVRRIQRASTTMAEQQSASADLDFHNRGRHRQPSGCGPLRAPSAGRA
jgi:DNA-binding FadR family transcriptional regulator